MIDGLVGGFVVLAIVDAVADLGLGDAPKIFTNKSVNLGCNKCTSRTHVFG